MKAEEKLTEKQWASKMKRKGFELYKTKELKPIIYAYNKIEVIIEGMKLKK